MYKSSSHKHKRREAEPEWYWDKANQDYYQVYEDAHGQTQYIWANAAASRDANTPRDIQDDQVAQITEGMENLTHGQKNYVWTNEEKSKESEVPGETEIEQTISVTESLDNPTTHPYETQHREAHHAEVGFKSKSKSSKSKGKGKQREHHDYTHEELYPTAGSSTVDNHDETEDYYATANTYYQQPDPSAQYIPNNYQASDEQAQPEDFDQEQADMEAAIEESTRYNDNLYSTVGESSTQGQGYEQYDDGDGLAPSTPDNGMTSLMEEMEECGQLDSRYKIEHSTRFQPGTIFKVYWAEPEGSSRDQIESGVSVQREVRNRFGTKFYFGFRRFIVVANDQGHSTCVPILTYGGKACKKKGVKPEKHGIIHDRNQKPRSVDREPKLGFRPVRVDITEEGERLARESRVNYSKLVTVEHNVKVLFIGTIYGSDFDIVTNAVDSCWTAKIRHKHKSKR